eukprot:s1061_g1.t1
MASVEQVRKWADQFEALDESGTGQIKVKDLVQKVAQQSEGQAERINEVLKLTADASQEISYSAFLAACLFQHHSNLEENHLRELFQKLDKDPQRICRVGDTWRQEKKGKVTVEEMSKALDGIVNLEGLESDFGSRALSFTDFRWLLQRPLTPSSLVGLRQLLGLYEDSGIAKSWRVDTVRAKTGDESVVPLWPMASSGPSGGVISPAVPSVPSSAGGTHGTSPISLSPVELLPPGSKPPSRSASRTNSKAPTPCGSPRETELEVPDKSPTTELSPEALTATWQVATAEAKDGKIL